MFLFLIQDVMHGNGIRIWMRINEEHYILCQLSLQIRLLFVVVIVFFFLSV